MSEDESIYWSEVFWSPPLFEINTNKVKEQYYRSVSSLNEYEVYIISEKGDFIGKKTISQEEILIIIKNNFKDYWRKNINVTLINGYGTYLNSNYGKHSMYVEAGYEKIIEILFFTLEKLNYYHESSDYTSVEKYSIDKFHSVIRHNLNADNFNTVAYMFKSEYSQGYPGCLIIIQNLPFVISNLEELSDPLYEWILERLENIPCVVEFEFNFMSHFSFGNSVFEYFITPFYLELSKLKIKSVIFTIDNNAFYIKTNPYLDDKERLRQIDAYTGNIIDPKSNIKLVDRAIEILGSYWERLSETSKLSLPVGLELYRIYKMHEGNILDSTTASIQFSKVVEIEIEQKILIPFKNYFNKSNFKKSDIDLDLMDDNFSRITKFLINSNSKTPEMGTFSRFLSVVKNSKLRAETSPTIISFKSFISGLKNPEFLLSKELIDMLNLITNKYRNGSAHTKILPFDYLNEFYLMLIGNDCDGLFFRLLDSISEKPKKPNN